MKFGYTLLYVQDVESTVNFYQSCFDLKLGFMTPEKDYAQLHTGETSLGFVSFELASSHGFKVQTQNENSNFEIALVSENIEKDFERAIENGATKVTDLSEKPWGQKIGYLKDRNGFLIEVCTPLPKEKIVYEVQIEVNSSIKDNFEKWLREHISEMLQIQGFLTAKIFTEIENQDIYRVQYILESSKVMKKYEVKHAENMRSKIFNIFNKNDLKFKRSLYKNIS